MSDANAIQTRHLEREYDRLASELMHYYSSIVVTERLALGGAAAVVAFLYTDLPEFAVGQAAILSAVPFALIVLAALRCFSIFVTMVEAGRYLRRIETALLIDDDFGIQRHYRLGSSPVLWLITSTTTLFWLLATAGAGYFWLVYAPAGGN